MSSIDTKTIAQNALIACIYAVLTLTIAPLAYSEIQFRFSEALVFLAFYHRKWVPGLTIGCFLANLASPLGWYDLLFGTVSTIIVTMGMSYLKNRYVAATFGAVVTGLLIGFELTLAFATPFIWNMVYVTIGEWVVLLLGAIIFGQLEKHNALINLIS